MCNEIMELFREADMIPKVERIYGWEIIIQGFRISMEINSIMLHTFLTSVYMQKFNDVSGCHICLNICAHTDNGTDGNQSSPASLA